MRSVVLPQTSPGGQTTPMSFNPNESSAKRNSSFGTTNSESSFQTSGEPTASRSLPRAWQGCQVMLLFLTALMYKTLLPLRIWASPFRIALVSASLSILCKARSIFTLWCFLPGSTRYVNRCSCAGPARRFAANRPTVLGRRVRLSGVIQLWVCIRPRHQHSSPEHGSHWNRYDLGVIGGSVASDSFVELFNPNKNEVYVVPPKHCQPS